MKTPQTFICDLLTCLGLSILLLVGSLCRTDAGMDFFQAHRRIVAKLGETRILEKRGDIRIREKLGDIDSCLSRVGAKILLPGSDEYETSRKRVWNQRTLHEPAAIVLATTAKHVQKAVKCARKYKIPIAPRSGGHSYEGYGTGGRDGVIVVDLGGLNNLTFHNESMTATAGPGLRLGQVYYRLWTAGKVAIPAGTCPTVGLGGHALGGGWGLLARKYGIAMDSILEMQVVTSTGKLVTANNETNSDLFAALKGAGHNNYGIVTQFKLRVYDLSYPVTLFEYFFNAADLVPVLKAFEQMAKTAPPEITGSLRQDAAGHNLLAGTCLMTLGECETLLQPYIEGIVPVDEGPPLIEVSFIQTVLVNGGLSITNDPSVLDVPDDISPAQGYTKAKDLVVKGDGLTDEGIQTFVDYLSAGPLGNATFTILGMYGNNSHTNKQPVQPGDGWIHRDALYNAQLVVNFTSDVSNSTYYLDYADGWFEAIQPYATPFSEQNFMDADLPISYYYGDNLEALEYTKRKWDRGNVFNYNQSIPVKSCELCDM